MTRPRCSFRVRYCPKTRFFKPDPAPSTDLHVIDLSPEETEALRLKNIKDLDQNEAALAMNVSQSTFQRVLASAHKKVSEAVVYGRPLRLLVKEETERS
jgi:predicted DNA-binding protein (UPF0251 family)